MVDERGAGADDQEQEVEDPHGVLVLCGALRCVVAMYNARAASRAHLLLRWRPTWFAQLPANTRRFFRVGGVG